jgi:hypothetical protein
MKELSIEQKAQRYDEAINRMKRYVIDEYGCTRIRVTDVFPELKESEDERIIREITKFLVDFNNGWYERPGENTIDSWLAWLEKQGEQKSADTCDSSTINGKEFPAGEKRDFGYFSKPTDKVEPKFKVGDWIVNNKSKDVFFIKSINSGYCSLEDTKGNIYSPCLPFESDFHLWTIKDAKPGDVLVVGDEDGEAVAICGNDDEYGNKILVFYYDVENGVLINTPIAKECLLHPCDKKQRAFLFQKMHEAGYEWDAEKKELKKIEQKPAELPKGEEYGIDGLYAAVNILEKTLGKVDGYQTDDGILEHECAISAVKELSKQKPAEWSEEDEIFVHGLIRGLSAKRDIHGHTTFSSDCIDITETINWLKSLRPQNTWKPSEEQMAALEKATHIVGCKYKSCLNSLYSDLIKLREK